MNDAYEFRRQAVEARELAARSATAEDKAFWYSLAEDWMKLAREADEGSTPARHGCGTSFSFE